MKLIFVTALVAASLLMPHPYADTHIFMPEEEPVVKEIIVEEVIEEPAAMLVDLPVHDDNSFKTYMDYRMITDTTSQQWAMQQEAYTDENGLRKIGDYYCVALGSGISNSIGNKFLITLESGEQIKVIMAEQKADRHTDPSNRYIDRGDGSINIVEFIVQTENLPDIVRIMGDVSHMPGNLFFGNIVEMEEIVE